MRTFQHVHTFPIFSNTSRSSKVRAAQVISTNWPDPDLSAAGRVTSLRLQMLRGWLGDEVLGLPCFHEDSTLCQPFQ